jgi:hypothetical protein
MGVGTEPGPRGHCSGGGPGTGHPPPSALLGGCLAGGGSASRAGQPRSGRRALRVQTRGRPRDSHEEHAYSVRRVRERFSAVHSGPTPSPIMKLTSWSTAFGAAFVMVDFSDGVLPSWSGPVPPGDLAAIAPRLLRWRRSSRRLAFITYAHHQGMIVCGCHTLRRVSGTTSREPRRWPRPARPDEDRRPSSRYASNPTTKIGVFRTDVQCHFTSVRRTPIFTVDQDESRPSAPGTRSSASSDRT